MTTMTDWEVTEYTIRVKYDPSDAPPTEAVEQFCGTLLTDRDEVLGVEAIEGRPLVTKMERSP